jgi:cytochrome c oxidase assembly factor CtaG
MTMLVRHSVVLMVAALILVLGTTETAQATTLPPDPTLRFYDMEKSAPYAGAIEALAEAGIVQGDADCGFGL